MTPQLQAFWLFVVISLIVVAVFAWVVLSTRQAAEIDMHRAYDLRRRFFYVVTVALVAALALTFPLMPYPKAEQRPDRVVFVVGQQFAFAISDHPITNSQQWEEATYAPPVEIPSGELVEFRVTSLDVNHGFGIYSPSGQLLAQVQAMPGYVNRLRLRLQEPGTYRALCLELCGMGHHGMRGSFVVVPNLHAAGSVSAIGR